MKKILFFLLLGVFCLPLFAGAQVSSTVQRNVVPVLKKAYQTTTTTSTASVKPQSTPTRSVLKVGMRGEDVRYLQAWLFNQGFDLQIDGVFGRGTQNALIAFQKSTNGALTADGVFGPRAALYIQDLPTGVALKNLDSGTVNYFKGKHIATVSGKETNTANITASSALKSAPKTTAPAVLAKLPRDVKSVLSNALPEVNKSTKVEVLSTTSTGTTSVTSKPKAEVAALLSRAKVSLVTFDNSKTASLSGPNLKTNFSAGIAGLATKEYICAELDGDNTCVAVEKNISEAVKSGQLSARDVLADMLGKNTSDCPFCSRDANGNLILTSGGGCGAGGGPGSGEFITPPGTSVGTDPNACVPLEDIAGKNYSLAVTSDNVFTAYFGLKGANGQETLQIIGKDMNWNEPTGSGTSTQPGWKSAESFSGTAPANVSNIYFAAFHDGWVTHGFLASLTVGGKKYETGNPVFEVTKTSTPGPDHPNDFNTNDVLNQIKNASWAQTFLVGDGTHGMYPWGVIPGIPLSAKWIFEGNNWDPEGKRESYEIYKLKICEGPVPPVLAGDICLNFGGGYATYKVSFPDNIVIQDNGNKNNIKLLVNTPGSAPDFVANYAYQGADGKSLYFVGLSNGNDLANHIGTPVINLSAGASIKYSNGNSVNLNIAELTASKLCPDEGWGGSYEGLIYITSVTKGPQEVLANGQHKLKITVNFANSQSGNPNAYITGAPALQLTTSTLPGSPVDATLPLVDGAGTQTLTFELTRSAPFDLVTFSKLKLINGSIHTLTKNAAGQDVYAPANLSNLNL